MSRFGALETARRPCPRRIVLLLTVVPSRPFALRRLVACAARVACVAAAERPRCARRAVGVVVAASAAIQARRLYRFFPRLHALLLLFHHHRRVLLLGVLVLLSRRVRVLLGRRVVVRVRCWGTSNDVICSYPKPYWPDRDVTFLSF